MHAHRGSKLNEAANNLLNGFLYNISIRIVDRQDRGVVRDEVHALGRCPTGESSLVKGLAS